jgi:hypothetical protein
VDPALLEYLVSGQGLQVLEDVAPSMVLNVPGEQRSQLVDPLLLE